MKKYLLFLFLATFSMHIAHAQSQELLQKLEQQRIKKEQIFDRFYKKAPQPNDGLKTQSLGETRDIEQLRKTPFTYFNGYFYFVKEFDADQVKSADADAIQSGSVTGLSQAYNGENMEVAIFDGGRVLASHSDFNNLPNRITNLESDTAVAYSNHSTMVAGIIGGKGTELPDNIGNTKGMMTQSKIYSYSFNTTYLLGEASPKTVMEKIVTSPYAISNHSYGYSVGWDSNGIRANWYGYYNPATKTSYDMLGTYMWDDEDYDRIVYDNPDKIIVKAAGNEYGAGGTEIFKYYQKSQDNWVRFTSDDVVPPANCAEGYDCISYGSLAKNIIVVAATEKLTTADGRYHQTSDIVHASYSNAGPRDDGAIKPDIAAIGSEVIAASVDKSGNEEWGQGPGTSFASPMVMGIIGLWSQIHKDLFGSALNASTAKTLMAHSAHEAGTSPGPDVVFGWGYIDAQRGAEILAEKSAGSVYFEEKTLQNKVDNTKEVIAKGGQPLKVTISWIDPAYDIPDSLPWGEVYNNRDSRLINDLDLRIVDTSNNTVYMPWKIDINNPTAAALKGDNTVDNIEQVVIDTPTAGGTYRVEISNKGDLVNAGGTIAPQKYSIIITGGTISTLGTNEANLDKLVSLYPSITSDFVNIKIPTKATRVRVYDMSGKLVKNLQAENKMKINVQDLQQGAYIVLIQTPEGSVTKKFIKK